jgi:hypothetical protein
MCAKSIERKVHAVMSHRLHEGLSSRTIAGIELVAPHRKWCRPLVGHKWWWSTLTYIQKCSGISLILY